MEWVLGALAYRGQGSWMLYYSAVYRKATLRSRRGPVPKGPMVRLTVHELLARRGITAYALSRGAQLSYPSAYRLSRPDAGFGRLHADTLERLCAFFEVQPGELLEWIPAKRRAGRVRSRPRR